MLRVGAAGVMRCRYVDAALYLTELQADGVLGAVGVTNFDVPRLEAMVNKGAQIVSNQVGAAIYRNHYPWTSIAADGPRACTSASVCMRCASQGGPSACGHAASDI